MMKNYQHQHKGNQHTQKKSQDAATFMEDAVADTVHTSGVRPSVFVTKESAEFHAWEAVGFPQEGRESHQVFKRGVHIVEPKLC